MLNPCISLFFCTRKENVLVFQHSWEKKTEVGPYIHVDLISLHTTHPNITAATQNQPGRVIYPTRSQKPFEEQDKGPEWSYPASKLPRSQSNLTSVGCNRTADGSMDLPHRG